MRGQCIWGIVKCKKSHAQLLGPGLFHQEEGRKKKPNRTLHKTGNCLMWYFSNNFTGLDQMMFDLALLTQVTILYAMVQPRLAVLFSFILLCIYCFTAIEMTDCFTGRKKKSPLAFKTVDVLHLLANKAKSYSSFFNCFFTKIRSNVWDRPLLPLNRKAGGGIGATGEEENRGKKEGKDSKESGRGRGRTWGENTAIITDINLICFLIQTLQLYGGLQQCWKHVMTCWVV